MIKINRNKKEDCYILIDEFYHLHGNLFISYLLVDT
ncbi:hypothetical protein ACSSV5_001444 [Psychroflexus sp. MBR-150]|jgi:hypothetical protein